MGGSALCQPAPWPGDKASAAAERPPWSSSRNRAQRGHRVCGLARSKGHRVELDRSSPTSGTALIWKAVPHPHSPWVRGVQAPHPGPSGSSSSRVNGPPFPQACVSPEPTGLSRLGPQPPPAALRWLSPCAPPAGSMAAEPGTGAEGGDPERPGQGDRAGHPPAGGRHDAGPGGEREGSREPVRLSAVGPWPRGPAPRCCAPRAAPDPAPGPLASSASGTSMRWSCQSWSSRSGSSRDGAQS